MENLNFKTLKITQKSPNSGVFHLTLNTPTLRNALTLDFFSEFPQALSSLDQNPDVAVVILSGTGAHFCSGIDFKALGSATGPQTTKDHGRIRERLRRSIKAMQDAITAVERCRKPVIAVIHGGCIGGGVDVATACDVRYCSEDAFFCVKEVDLAITADLGTLQRLPRIVGYGNAVELALTARRVSAGEAKSLGLVSRVFGSKESMDEEVEAIAEGIAAKSPLAIAGTKAVLLRSLDMTTEQGLDYVATWNSSMILSDDLTEAVSAQVRKRKSVFAKL